MPHDAIDLDGIAVPLGGHLTPTIRRELEAGEYEQAELAVLRDLLEPDDIVMEVGTGLGFLSAWCAQIVGSERIFTFEANPALESAIRDLYALNNVSPNLEMSMLAASAGHAKFYPRREFWASSAIAGNESVGSITVPTRAFGEVRAKIGPNLLIVDIEGGELELMRHVRLDGIERVLIELHPEVIGEEGCETVAVTLAEAGYAVAPAIRGSDTVFGFERVSDATSAVDTRLSDALAELPWHRAERALARLLETVPSGGRFVLLDDSIWGEDEFGDRRRQFLVERSGEDYGLPDAGAAAVAELNARREGGARWLAVAWPAFWWFDVYPDLLRHLQTLREIASTRDIRIWELSSM